MGNPVNFYSRAGKTVEFYTRPPVELNVLNLSFTGSDGDTTTTDTGAFSRTVTQIGSVELDSDQFVSSPTSSYHPPIGTPGEGPHYWAVQGHSFFDAAFFNGNWTMSTWFRLVLDNSGYTTFTSWWINAFSWVSFFYADPPGFSTLNFQERHSANPPEAVAVNFNPILNVWHYVEVTKTGDDFSFFSNDTGTGERYQVGSNQTQVMAIGNYSGVTQTVGGTQDSIQSVYATQGWTDETKVIAEVERPVNFYG